MVGILEAGRKAFEQYKKDIVSGVLYGLAVFLVGALSLIPILGAFIWAYLGPRIASWYYNKTIGNIKTDYGLAFKAWLIFGLIMHVVFLLGLFLAGVGLGVFLFGGFRGVMSDPIGMLIKLGAAFGIAFLVFIVFGLLYTYTLYASVLGKINRIEINVKKSVYLFVYLMIWSILLGIIAGILGAIPLVGAVLAFTYQIFVMYPLIALVAANFVLSS